MSHWRIRRIIGITTITTITFTITRTADRRRPLAE
jgi:hypothetical protein